MDRAELIAQGQRLANEYVENADISHCMGSCCRLAKQNPQAAIMHVAYKIVQEAKHNLECDLPPV